jgi:photosystem II stability/assembly factor-like uncharacterized protein
VFAFTGAGGFVVNAATGAVAKLPTPANLKLAAAGIGVFYAVCGDRDAYRSDDMGQTWVPLPGMDADYGDPSSTRTVRHIAVSYYHPEKVYFSIWRRPLVLPSVNLPGEMYDAAKRHPYLDGRDHGAVTRFGILVSENSGGTWKWSVAIDMEIPDNVYGGWFENSYDADWCGSPWYIHVSDHNPNQALAALQGFAWDTADGGATWRNVYCERYEDGSWYGKGLESTACNDVCFDPHDKDTLFITYSDNGLLKSTNGGKSWKHAIQGVPYSWINTCYSMAFDPDIPGLAWGTWTSVHGLPWSRIYRENVFAKPFAGGGICVTTDGAETWRAVTDPLAGGCAFTGIIIDPTTPVGNRTLYAGHCKDGVYKSTDNGVTWERKSNGFEENKDVLVLKRLEDGTLYAITMMARAFLDETTEDARRRTDGGIYISTDGAESWRRLVLPEFITNVRMLDVDPTNPRRILFSAFPADFGGVYKGGGVYESLDGGLTWKCIFDETVRVHGLQIDPKNPARIYIATYEFAAYRTLDGGNTWERIRGYNFKCGQNVFLDPHNQDMMYITTFGASACYGPRAGYPGGRYDDIDGIKLGAKAYEW